MRLCYGGCVARQCSVQLNRRRCDRTAVGGKVNMYIHTKHCKQCGQSFSRSARLCWGSASRSGCTPCLHAPADGMSSRNDKSARRKQAGPPPGAQPAAPPLRPLPSIHTANGPVRRQPCRSAQLAQPFPRKTCSASGSAAGAAALPRAARSPRSGAGLGRAPGATMISCFFDRNRKKVRSFVGSRSRITLRAFAAMAVMCEAVDVVCAAAAAG